MKKCIKNISCITSMILFSNFFPALAQENNPERTISGHIMSTYNENITEENSFFGLTSRLRYINRWSTLQCCEHEDLENHSFEVAIIAHALVTIKNIKFNSNLDANRAAVLALYHDVTEIVTGDMPSPIKYYNKDLKPLYSTIEEKVIDEMIQLLPEEFREIYRSILLMENENDEELAYFVKAADIISAIIKCYREKKLDNKDFDRAQESLIESINKYQDPAVKYFLDTFLPAFGYNSQK